MDETGTAPTNLLFGVKISYLQPVELNGYIEAASQEAAKETIMTQAKAQGHLDLKILEINAVDIPDEKNTVPTSTALN